MRNWRSSDFPTIRWITNWPSREHSTISPRATSSNVQDWILRMSPGQRLGSMLKPSARSRNSPVDRSTWLAKSHLMASRWKIFMSELRFRMAAAVAGIARSWLLAAQKRRGLKNSFVLEFGLAIGSLARVCRKIFLLVLIRFRSSILLSHECSLPLGDARAFKDVLCIAQGEGKGYFKLDPCGTRIMISTRFHLGPPNVLSAQPRVRVARPPISARARQRPRTQARRISNRRYQTAPSLARNGPCRYPAEA